MNLWPQIVQILTDNSRLQEVVLAPNAPPVRVAYFTQRGSRVLRIVRIPFEVPTIEALCASPPRAQEIVRAICDRRLRLILAHGPVQLNNGKLVYALMREINKTFGKVLYIAERMISFITFSHAWLPEGVHRGLVDREQGLLLCVRSVNGGRLGLEEAPWRSLKLSA